MEQDHEARHPDDQGKIIAERHHAGEIDHHDQDIRLDRRDVQLAEIKKLQRLRAIAHMDDSAP